MTITLSNIEPVLRKFILFYVLTMSVGVLLGLSFLFQHTSFTPEQTKEHIRGSVFQEDEIPVNNIKYEKSVNELLMTTHNHIIGFSFIFLTIGGIFYFNTIVNGKLKIFFMLEPFISIIVSFGSIWGIRFVADWFVYPAIISGMFLYVNFIVMSGVIVYEISKKRGL